VPETAGSVGARADDRLLQEEALLREPMPVEPVVTFRSMVDVVRPIAVIEQHPAALSVRAANDAMLDRSLTDRSNVERLVALDDVLADEWRLPLLDRLNQYGSSR
jgi:hypothetical protein